METIFLKLGDRIVVTDKEEIEKVVLFIRPRVNKFSDIIPLLTEYKYMFKNCDPIWS